MRSPRRLAIATLVAIATLGILLPSIAEATVLVKAPSKSICLGKTIRVGVRYRQPGKRSFTITITDPTGRTVWTRRGLAGATWRSWSFRPAGLGTFRTVYRRPGRDKRFRTTVVACSENSILLDDDYGSAMLVLAEAAPGDTAESCVRVTYAGSDSPTVRLYGSTTGTGLDRYLELVVLRGTLPERSGSCAEFVPDATDYLGAGPGVIFRGTLRELPDAYETGLAVPAEEAEETWNNGETHAYRFLISLVDDNQAQGLSADQRFVWEARAP